MTVMRLSNCKCSVEFGFDDGILVSTSFCTKDGEQGCCAIHKAMGYTAEQVHAENRLYSAAIGVADGIIQSKKAAILADFQKTFPDIVADVKYDAAVDFAFNEARDVITVKLSGAKAADIADEVTAALSEKCGTTATLELIDPVEGG